MKIKSKILLAMAGVLMLFSGYSEAAFLFSKEELKAREVSGPCWFVQGGDAAKFKNCGVQAHIKEIEIWSFGGSEYSLYVGFESEDVSAMSDLIDRVKAYGIVFEERIGKTLYLRGTAEQIRIVLSLINEIDPLSQEVVAKASCVLGYLEGEEKVDWWMKPCR